jgi:phosphoribosylaminoimidazolecarboxamide formyltransferase / IMP cyclohydrolase
LRKISRALISVTDKSGLAAFAQGLAELKVEILSTGGTARLLRDAGVAVKDVSEVTAMPEMLDGRVKTLHPAVHGAILARRDNAEHLRTLERLSIGLIDLVVVNLYQFEKTASRPGASFAEIIEDIDIGGPAMIRSAAKNHQDVAIVTSPEDYSGILDEMRNNSSCLSPGTLWSLAQKAFACTARYDSAISRTLAVLDYAGNKRPQSAAKFPPELELRYEKLADLRYGENPHQAAAVYVVAGSPRAGIAGARQLQGKELSFNNLVDLEAAWNLVRDFEEPATAIIKHTNPCGAAVDSTLAESYRKALATDPVSAYGGVLGFNRPLDGETAEQLGKNFVEAIVAPGFTKESLDRLSGKKNLRLVEVDTSISLDREFALKQVSGGLLVQDKDRHVLVANDLKAVTARRPSPEEIASLLFAWKIVKHVKSNAIVYARDRQLVGVGAGQMSRVDSVKLGASKAILPLQGTVLASDAFFPFPDGIEEASKAGVVAVIQPGGSIRDQEVIAAADRLGLAMVFTGVRHFMH